MASGETQTAVVDSSLPKVPPRGHLTQKRANVMTKLPKQVPRGAAWLLPLTPAHSHQYHLPSSQVEGAESLLFPWWMAGPSTEAHSHPSVTSGNALRSLSNERAFSS